MPKPIIPECLRGPDGLPCIFFEDDYVNDDGDATEGWGCVYPHKCKYQEEEREIK